MKKSVMVGVIFVLAALMVCPLGAFAEGVGTERIVVGEKTLFGNAAIFTSDGSTLTTTNVTNATAAIEGTALVAKQGTGTANGIIRIQSVSGLKGRTGKVVIEFDFSSGRSTGTMKLKWGQSWSDSSSATICNPKAKSNQEVTKVKAIMDFNEKTVTAYYDGEKQTATAIPDAANKGTVSMYMHLEGIKANGTLNYVKIDNFTMYETNDTAFTGAAANGGAAFNLPIDETQSSATVDGQSAKLVRMAESETVINTYYADYSALSLAPGTHDVTISAVPLGGTSADAKSVTYSVTVLEPLALSDFSIDSAAGKASITAKNNTSTEKKMTMIIAEYDAAGKLVNAAAEEKTAVVSENAQSFEIELAGVSASNTLKAFVWDSLSGMKPLAGAK